MTKDELKEQFKRLIIVNSPLNKIEELFNKAVDSGAIDFSKEEPESFGTAKVIYYAILKILEEEWKPVTRSRVISANNLIKFL